MRYIIYMYVRFMISGQLSIMIHHQLLGNHPEVSTPLVPVEELVEGGSTR